MSALAPMAAVARREWRVLVGSALGWSVMAAMAALAGTVFAVAVLRPGAPATLRGTFIALGWAVMLVAPALSMRTIVDERRSGNWALLAASPAGFASIVAGKFLAAFALMAIAVIVPVAAQVAALEWVSRPDLLEAATGTVGLLLAGAAYLASGILMSALVMNQVAAYLFTAFLWITWLALARSLPAVLPAQAADAAFALDPLRRLDDFTIGILDTGNVAFFAACVAWFLGAAVVASARASLPSARARPVRVAAGLALGLVACVAGVAALDAPAARRTVDMTKSRAYTLSEPTRGLLASLGGEWRVAVVLSSPAPTVARQVDEVLARIAEQPMRDGRVRAERVDPADPRDAARYESLLEAVHARDAGALARHDEAIRGGRAAFDRLAAMAAAQAPLVEDLVTMLPPGDPSRAGLDALRGGFAQLVAQKRAFDRSIDALRTAGDARPFPEEARAAAALGANLKHWGEELAAASRTLGERAADPSAPSALAAWLADAPASFAAMARELRAAQDALDRLPRLWGSEVGAALAAGDCALVMGPPGIAVVPPWQIVSSGASGAVGFDRRFRGEQAIAAGIRSVVAGEPPITVVVHSGAPGILRNAPDGSDFAAAADALRSARIDVREWVPGDGPQPTAPAGRPIVWIIVPPTDRDAVNESPRERALLAAARRLVAQGQPVLLTVGPSLLPLLGQQDPWSTLLGARGLGAQTGRTVLELVAVGPGRRESRAEQAVLDGERTHALGRSVDGQRLYLERPVPVDADASRGARAVSVIEPSHDRWVENDWRRDQRVRSSAPESKRFDEPVAVVAATSGDGARAVLVGSPTWMTTAVCDAADPLGGGRVALRNPGNRELLVNAVLWLAGRDAQVAGAGTGREVERVPRLARAEVVAIDTVQAVLVPGAIAAIGAAVVVRRRLRT